MFAADRRDPQNMRTVKHNSRVIPTSKTLGLIKSPLSPPNHIPRSAVAANKRTFHPGYALSSHSF